MKHPSAIKIILTVVAVSTALLGPNEAAKEATVFQEKGTRHYYSGPFMKINN